MKLPRETLKIIIRLDWSDLDVYEHINNVSIIRYLQSARVNFWELSGLYESFQYTNRGPMLVSTNCNFKKSLYYPGSITVESKIGFMKNSSFSLEHTIYNEDGIPCVEATDIAVCYDFNTEETYCIPEAIRTFMESHSSVRKEI